MFGVALIGQGGVGFSYLELLTESGKKDELSANFGMFRVAPAVAWQATEKLSLGLSLAINFSQADQKAFPETSILPSENSPGFAGLDLNGLHGLSTSYRLGIQCEFNEELTLGVAYGGPAALKLNDGSAVVNFSAHGLGKVKYQKAKIKGLGLAADFNVGIAWQANSRWMVAAEINYLQWSNSMNNLQLTLSRPDNSSAPPVISVDTPLDFKDQLILSMGAACQWQEGTHFLGGISYGKNPVPKETLNPVFNLINEYHYTM